MLGIYEVGIPLICAVALMICGMISDDHYAIIYTIFSTVMWFATGIVWLIDGGVSAIGVLFMGLGIVLIVIAIAQGMMVTQEQISENL